MGRLGWRRRLKLNDTPVSENEMVTREEGGSSMSEKSILYSMRESVGGSSGTTMRTGEIALDSGDGTRGEASTMLLITLMR